MLLPNAKTIYEVPLTLEKEGIGDVITDRLGIGKKRPKLKNWEKFVKKSLKKPEKTYRIGVVAKYLNNQDTYMSVFEALKGSGLARVCYCKNRLDRC